jgi:hypothetical protein
MRRTDYCPILKKILSFADFSSFIACHVVKAKYNCLKTCGFIAIRFMYPQKKGLWGWYKEMEHLNRGGQDDKGRFSGKDC